MMKVCTSESLLFLTQSSLQALANQTKQVYKPSYLKKQ